MRGNFEKCLALTLEHEGGWADHPKDPGGATMKGITLATYRTWRPGATKAQLRAITDAEVAQIYRAGYWDRVKGDDLPAGLDLVAFDGAVNSGTGRGARWLQSAVGMNADGQIGPKTIAAAEASIHADVIRRACQARMVFLQSLKTWPTFGKGWTRRVVAIEAAALRMVGASPAPVTPPAQGGIVAALLSFLARILRGAK